MGHLAIYAQDFLNAYEILSESNEALVERMTRGAERPLHRTAFGTLPAMGIEIVCLAFSVELHLKELHRLGSGSAPRGHNITKLFNSLPMPVKTALVSHSAIAKYGWSGSQIESELLAISDGFEKWRYAYESVTLNYNVYFAKALIEASQFVASRNVRGA